MKMGLFEANFPTGVRVAVIWLKRSESGNAIKRALELPKRISRQRYVTAPDLDK